MMKTRPGGRVLALLLALLVGLSGLSGLGGVTSAAQAAEKPEGKQDLNDPPRESALAASRHDSIGAVAGQDFEWCRTHVLEANDDSSSEAVEIPFDLTFFGRSHDHLYVNNNGNITFNDAEAQYTPEDLTTDTGRPMIAPFFADVDTRGEGSQQVTYGASPDGSAFCVNWVDVGYFSHNDDLLNSFQLILRSTQGQPGRSAGDFDITFNYDRIQWETGDASYGEGGLGGTSAAVGFTDGTGEPGTFVQVTGSLVNGALLDGGSNALTGNQQGSTQRGRYNFQVRNAGTSERFGTLLGTVVDADGDRIPGAYVEVCTQTGRVCDYTETDQSGEFGYSARAVGVQHVRVWPPDGDLIAGGGTVTVVAGETVRMTPIVLTTPVGMPPNVRLNGETGDGGVPSVYYGDPLPLRITGCAGVSAPTYSVLVEGRLVRDRLPLTEGPAGVYTATIAPLHPETGAAEIRTNVPATCGGSPTAFNVYIDPSGTVTDQWGRPVAGATVTLLRADVFDGPYTVVPDGSDIMSPSNRQNPDTTDTAGFFRWDVTAGWYKVKVEAPQCTATTTGAMEVPPEKVDLVIRLSCPSLTPPAPTVAPEVKGDLRVGGTITASPATWAGPLQAGVTVLLRNGEVLPTTSYRIRRSDIGAVFSVRSTAQRPDYVDEGQEMTVSFEAATANSEPTTGERAASRTVLKVAKKHRKATGKKVKVTVVVTSPFSTAGKVRIKAGNKVVAVKKVKAGIRRSVTVQVRVAKLKKGKNRLAAVFSGSKATAGSKSSTTTVRVLRR